MPDTRGSAVIGWDIGGAHLKAAWAAKGWPDQGAKAVTGSR
ncbi:hypothetical protein [Azospirillum largimobile]